MLAFFISVLFGICEVLLLSAMMESITKGYRSKAIKIFIIKFLTYGVAIALLMFKFFKYYTYCLCGFAAGMPITAILIFVYKAFLKDTVKDKIKTVIKKFPYRR